MLLLSVALSAQAAGAEPLRELIAALGGPGLREDRALSVVAMEHARDIARRPGNAQISKVKAALRKSGLADTQLLPFSAVGGPTALKRALRQFVEAEVQGQGYTHFGLGRARGRGGATLSVIFVRRLVALSALPRQLRRAELEVRGLALAKMPLQALLLGPCAPDCPASPVVLPIWRKDRRFAFTLPLPEPGRYTLELMAKTARGPETAAVWELERGKPRRRRPRWRSAMSFSQRLDQVRRAAGRRRLHRDPRLKRAALSHAKAVCAADRAAHVLPGEPGPVARARAAGYRGPISENVAIAPTAEAAHHNLMDSPSHRQNRLAEEARRVGIGIVRRAATATQRRAVCVVELFGS